MSRALRKRSSRSWLKRASLPRIKSDTSGGAIRQHLSGAALRPVLAFNNVSNAPREFRLRQALVGLGQPEILKNVPAAHLNGDRLGRSRTRRLGHHCPPLRRCWAR